ncbi:hypothetical protein FQN53_004743 [Emmonsiellopsis sp. PD_33]|nr:hypothetical protein FQN53_004743 [Emmonsiellopsis sp. PD_33]
MTSPPPSFDVYNTSTVQLQQLLGAGSLTSVKAVTAYLDQIDRHNTAGLELHAVIDTPPRALALKLAQALDDERARQGARGPLHGVPVLVKDIFNTDPELGMGTTCGSGALRGAKPKGNSAIVDLLIRSGAIVIGKANLSELACIKGSPPCTSGWSAAGGQVRHFNRLNIDKEDTCLGHSTPAGSSSGSASGIAAGFAPFSIGSETDGSLVYPASRAALYGLKLSHAKTPADIAVVSSIILGKSDLISSGDWKNLRIGFINPELWLLGAGDVKPNADYQKQYVCIPLKASKRYWAHTAKDTAMQNVIKTLESAGARVVQSIELVTVEQLAKEEDGVDFDVIAFDNWRANFEAYLTGFSESPISSLEAMIEFNKQHAKTCLPPGEIPLIATDESFLDIRLTNKKEQPSQGLLESLLVASPDPQAEQKIERLRQKSRAAIQEALKSHDVDILVAPDDSRLCAIASTAGYACGAAPLGFAEFNGRAFGVQLMAGNAGEEKIIQVMSAWEKTFPDARKAPPLMVNSS